ncbi:MAG: hypothetical protein V7746_05940 [Halioglobus sp.]
MAQYSSANASDDVDFGGNWELDYSRSDNIQARLDSMVRELRQRMERAQSGNMNTRNSGGASYGGGGAYNSGPSVIGLARMADLVTQSQLLEIEQGTFDIKVKREENFALTCEFYGKGMQSEQTPFGNELCGWNAHQFVFEVALPEGLSIRHVFTMGPTGKRLNIATTVVSDRVSYPFTLNRVYNRYEAGSNGISCELTLTRGKVCTTEAPK